jgi:hypothetical protein
VTVAARSSQRQKLQGAEAAEMMKDSGRRQEEANSQDWRRGKAIYEKPKMTDWRPQLLEAVQGVAKP